jgi:hypothetical protein
MLRTKKAPRSKRETIMSDEPLCQPRCHSTNTLASRGFRRTRPDSLLSLQSEAVALTSFVQLGEKCDTAND